LVDNDCHIWDGDAYKNYVKHWEPNIEYIDNKPILTQEEFINKIKTDDGFAKKWGELGPIYGKQWRAWGEGFKQIPNETGDKVYHITTTGIDQIQNLINDLKTNPDSRRLMVNAWNLGELDQMVLPPCHYGFQVYTRELSNEEVAFEANKRGFNLKGMTVMGKLLIDPKEVKEYNLPTRAISLMWNQRSVDTFLGLPFNIASYGLLLEILAKEVNMVPDELIGNLGDTHLYLNHVDQAKEQIGRDLSDEERYNKWFNLNYETGMERSFDPNNLPDFDNEYYEPTPKRTREPYPLPKLNINTEHWNAPFLEMISSEAFCKCLLEEDLQLYNYQSHPSIKAPLSN
jgi:thymidylate synthase